MANEKHIKGSSASLAFHDGTAYKPVICLTSTSHEMVMNLVERVSYCTEGKTVSSPQSISETVQIEGNIIDTTDLGGNPPQITGDELKELARNQVTSGNGDTFRLGRGASGYLYFTALISNISDSYPADGDATFSATLTIQGSSSSVDPKAAPAG